MAAPAGEDRTARPLGFSSAENRIMLQDPLIWRSGMAIKVAFLDRDGTINVDRGYVHRREDWQFTDRALDQALGAHSGRTIDYLSKDPGDSTAKGKSPISSDGQPGRTLCKQIVSHSCVGDPVGLAVGFIEGFLD